MVKRGKLTQQEKYVIQGMLNENKEVKEIATELDRTPQLVKNFIEKELDEIHSAVVQSMLEKELDKAQKAMRKKSKYEQKHTTKSGKEGVSIMLEGESQRLDNLNKKSSSLEDNRKLAPHIHKCKDEQTN